METKEISMIKLLHHIRPIVLSFLFISSLLLNISVPSYTQIQTRVLELHLSDGTILAPGETMTLTAVGAGNKKNAGIKWTVKPEELVSVLTDPYDVTGSTIRITGKALPSGMIAPTLQTVVFIATLGTMTASIAIPYQTSPVSQATSLRISHEDSSDKEISITPGQVTTITATVKDRGGIELLDEVEWKTLGNADKFIRLGKITNKEAVHSVEVFGIDSGTNSPPAFLLLQATVSNRISDIIQVNYNAPTAKNNNLTSDIGESAKDILVIKSGVRGFLSDYLFQEKNFNGAPIPNTSFLVLNPNEMIEVRKDCKIESSNNTSVAVADNKLLIGRRIDTDAQISIKCSPDVTKSFVIKVRNETDNKITTETTFVPYKTVKDSFGSRIADTFMVVQVNVNNKSALNQFYLQELQVMFDPRQCETVQKYYNEIVNYNIKDPKSNIAQRLNLDLTDDAKKSYVEVCRQYFNSHFFAPTPFEPVLNERVMAVGEMHQTLNIRKLGFSLLQFAADFGGPLTGLKLLGRDGIKGFGFLGTSIYASADKLVPNSAPRQFDALQKSLPPKQTIVKSRDHETINVFIPLDKVLTREYWDLYKKGAKKGTTMLIF